MLFEIINPCDPYTMDAPSLELAAVAIALIGEGQMGLKEIGGDAEVPVFLTGGHDEWFQEHCGKTFEQALEQATSAANMHQLIAILDGVVVGDEDDRKEFLEQLSALSSPGEREDFRWKWHEEKRTSLHKIAEYAWKMGDHLRRRLANGQVEA